MQLESIRRIIELIPIIWPNECTKAYKLESVVCIKHMLMIMGGGCSENGGEVIRLLYGLRLEFSNLSFGILLFPRDFLTKIKLHYEEILAK